MMSSTPGVIASWQAANLTSQFTDIDEQYSCPSSGADLRNAGVLRSKELTGTRGAVTFSLILCDSGDELDLKNTVASLLANDLSRTQVVLSGPVRRERELTRLLDQLGARTVVNLHLIEGATSFAELQASALGTAQGEFICFITAGD